MNTRTDRAPARAMNNEVSSHDFWTVKYIATQHAKNGTSVFTSWNVARQRLGTVNLDTIFFHSPFFKGLDSSDAEAAEGLGDATGIGGAIVSWVMIGQPMEPCKGLLLVQSKRSLEGGKSGFQAQKGDVCLIIVEDSDLLNAIFNLLNAAPNARGKSIFIMSEFLHNIKAVAMRTGLSAHVIRIWEKRYAAVTPARTGQAAALCRGGRGRGRRSWADSLSGDLRFKCCHPGSGCLATIVDSR